MVCKEDVLLWFKDLEGYKRIDVLYELLNMCLPFELRFLGTCMEEIGKHTYQELRGPAIKANEFEKVSADPTLCQGLMDEKVRHRVLIYLSLLSSRNYSVANWLYKNVIRTEGLDNILVKEYITDENVQSEFLLLFIMALHHPAFTFEHKLYFHKILSQLIELGDNKPPAPPKPSTVYAYPPIYGPPGKPIMVPQEIPVMPVKSALTVPCVDDPPPPPQHQHIPGIPHIVPQLPPEFGMTRSRPLSCGAPEVIIVPRPFPPPAVSPQINEQQQMVSSPVESRTNSPHRTGVPPPNHRNLQRPPPPPTPPQHQQSPLDIISTHQIPLEMLSSNSYAYHSHSFAGDGKLPIEPDETLHLLPAANHTKQHNGYRFSQKHSRQLDEQFSKINIDVDKPLQRSNSSSSSSLNQTPPETPSATPLTTTPQCSNRGDKARVNGIPQQYVSAGPPICDTTSPPPPTQFTFNNCSVPYSMPFTIPSRSLYPHHYRPPFPFASYQTNDNSLPNTVHHPYHLPLFFSPLQHLRHAHNCCFNCGSSGHLGQECTGQTIEDITQKTTYTLDYSSPPLPEK